MEVLSPGLELVDKMLASPFKPDGWVTKFGEELALEAKLSRPFSH